MTNSTVRLAVVVLGIANALTRADEPVKKLPLSVGSRRELFVERSLIDRLSGEAKLWLHHPVPREVVMVHDAPWEGNATAYHSVFKDGDRFRMYYRAWNLTIRDGKLDTGI